MSRVNDLHRHHTPAKLKTIAQNLYREQKYQEALEVFNAAICATKEDDLVLLDNRAATYEKLTDLTSSLKDGQRMLRADKASALGYLRTAKTLQAQGEAETALKIYERALKYVHKQDKHYGLLRTRRDELSMELSPPKSVDLLTVLPLEVINMIFSYIPFQQLCRCIRVSKQWKQLLTSWPTLWRNIDFSTIGFGNSVRHQTVSQYTSWSKFGVQRMSLKGLSLQGNKLLREIAFKCKDLQVLELNTKEELRQSLVDATARAKCLRALTLGPGVKVEQKTVFRIMNSAFSLETACFGEVIADRNRGEDPVWAAEDFINLRKFSIHYWHGAELWGEPPSMSSICPPATGLSTLHIRGMLGYDSYMVLEDLSITRPKLQDLLLHGFTVIVHYDDDEGFEVDDLRLPETIRKIAVGQRPVAGNLDASVNMPNLEELRILPGLILNVDFYQRLFQCAPGYSELRRLHTLRIPTATFEHNDFFDLLTEKRLSALRHLGLDDCAKLDDRTVETLAGTLKDLVTLSIRCSKITGVGVKQLVQSLPRLTRLDLDNCYDISSDAIAWARSQGIKVCHQLAA